MSGYGESGRKLINRLRESIHEGELRNRMIDVVQSDCPGYEYCKLVSGPAGKFKLGSLPNGFSISNSFRVPMRLKKRRVEKARDIRMNRIVQFLEMRSNPATTADIVELYERGQLPFSEEEFEEFINSDYARPWRIKDRNLTMYSNPVSTGRVANESENSYNKVEYPFGYPARSGLRPHEVSLLNVSMASTDQEVPDKDRVVRMNIHEMLWENMFFDVEDVAVNMDQERIRNFNVLKQLLSSTSGIITSQVLLDHLRTIYHNKAPLMALLLEKVPEIARPVILRRVEEKYKQIFSNHAQNSPALAEKWEVGRVQYRALYQEDGTIKDKVDIDISSEEIVFSASRVYLLSKYVDYVFEHNKQELNKKEIHESLWAVLSELRNSSHRSVKMTMGLATAVCLGARFVQELENCEVVDDANSYSVKLAVELGFTKREKHGYERILYLLAEWYTNPNHKSALVEVCGLLSDVNARHKISTITVLGKLFYRSLIYLAKTKRESEVEFINVGIRPGHVSILRSETGNRVVLDLQHL